MRRGFIPAGALAFVGFFICAAAAISADGDIVINEIGAYEGSGHEWIEIWNRGVEPVDINGWKFWEDGTNHGLTVTSSDSIVEVGEYAAICQDVNMFYADYPAFLGSVFDSSWGSLNESGEEIGLKNASGDFIEQFSYIGSPDWSLERINPYIMIYDETNWREHLTGNTIGLINSVFSTSSGSETPTTTPTSTPPVITPTSTPATSTVDWSVIKINEIVSDPEIGNEWVELFNAGTSSVDLSGCVICDSREIGCKSATGTLLAGGWLYFDLLTKSFLNNDADSVILKNASGDIVDRIDYNAMLAPGKGLSLARRIDGLDTNLSVDWTITTSLSPGAANVINIPTVPVTDGGSSSAVPTNDVIPVMPIAVSTSYQLVINEVLPNPSGPDIDGEYIEVKNLDNNTVDLNGWKIGDSVKQYALSGTIPPQGISFWQRTKTGISLNNTGKEEVKLVSPQDEIVDKVVYDGAPEGESYARTASGTYLWTADPTPGKENIFTVSGSGIVWKVSAPSTADINEMIIFSADDSADERGGMLSIRWVFDGNMIADGAEVAHAFSTSGVHAIKIYATSTLGSFGEKTINISVGAGFSQNESMINICEIFPNPAESEIKEFIELCNYGDNPVDLGGWTLRAKAKTYEMPSGAVISSGTPLVFYRTVTGLILDNQGGKVELLDRDNNVVDLVKYGKSAKAMSYMYDNAEWRWVDAPTPGAPNILLESSTKIPSIVKLSANKKTAVSYRTMAINEARQEDLNEGVIVRGTVVVLPGVFGSQYLYIFDGLAGIQVYQYKKDFPELAIGDVVEVTGVVSSAGGVKRIKIKTNKNADILETDKKIEPMQAVLGEISEEDAGSLVSFSGDITEIKTNYMYVDDGAGEIKIYFKKGARIDKKKFKEGDSVAVTGVVELSGNEIQVWPRNSTDITIQTSTMQVKGEKIVADNSQSSAVKKYFTVTLTGLIVLLFGVFGRAKISALNLAIQKFFQK